MESTPDILADLMNIIVEIPKGAVSLLAKARVVDDHDQTHKAEGTYSAADLWEAGDDFEKNQEGYYVDGAHELKEDDHPIILQIPEYTVGVVLEIAVMAEDLTVSMVQKKLNLRDITNARAEFLQYIGDDDYDAVYTLTPEGLAFLNKGATE